MQISPSTDLSAFIKHYLFLTTNNKEVKKLRLFSDGNTGMVFSFKNPLIAAFTREHNPGYLPGTFVYGQLSSFKDLYCMGETSLMIVVFHPHGLSNMLKIPSGELKNRSIPSHELFGAKGDELYERLACCNEIQDKIILAEDFFRGLLACGTPSDQPLISAAVKFIVQHKGLVTVNKLAAFTGSHERKLERVFTQFIGISPKGFSSIIKLLVFLKQLKDNPSKSNLTYLGHESGYYDQPHLIREFKKYTGLTPGQYTSVTNPLAINFLGY
ncbi:hypothetical protein TH53_03410 [Pedobacter lusitanus]|uniref:Contig13, whole genome shotgun sequence n=1 Tax=Pedobacter lusitanus TaxID=1503925 RepID=A0A0D0G125_9SPHI|nr:helix-turn-helix domain-containing protein [Pedobacter lusitanus]KIO78499.1 hypothetical protein TH53_03410 [Pedobacter lusitanus]